MIDSASPEIPHVGGDTQNRVLGWWKRYCHPTHGDPGIRARLRRCRSSTDTLSIAAAVGLARQLTWSRMPDAENDWRLIAALNLARVLAHVTDPDVTRRPMRAAGWQSFPGDRRESDAGDDRPRLSEARFRRLLQTERGEEQVTAFVRLVKLLDGRVNVSALADDFLHWNEQTKRRWAFEYYAAGLAAFTGTATSSEETDA